MKKFLVALAVFLMLGLSALANQSAQPPSQPNVCVVMITGQAGMAVNSLRSCDGEDLQIIERRKNMLIEEISFQLSELYSKGLHLINCQVNNRPDRVEYVCVTSR